MVDNPHQFRDQLPLDSVTMSETSRASLSILPDYKQWADCVKTESSPHTAKRKRVNGIDYDLEAAAITSEKRKKVTLSRVHRLNEEKDLDLDRGLNLTIAKLDSRLLAGYVANRTKWAFPDLSLVELKEMYIPGISHLGK